MLVDVCFPHQVRYLPPRARVARNETFLSRTVVEVREIGSSDAPLAYRLIPSENTRVLDGPSFRPADQLELVAFEGDVWWPFRNLADTAEVAVDDWMRELAKPRGNHTLGEYRLGMRIPDVLGVRKLAGPSHRGSDWPDKTINGVASRLTLADTHGEADTMLQQSASDIIVRDGRLYVRQGEPVWLMNAPIRHFQGGRFPINLHPRPCSRALDGLVRGIDPLVAFVDYELFRLDRKCDADRCRKERLERDRRRPERQFESGSDNYQVEVFDAPALKTEPLVPMLRDLGTAFMAMIAGMVATVRSSLPPLLRELPTTEIMTEYGPSYLQRLVGLAAPNEQADAISMLTFFDDVAGRLEGIDPRQELWGYLETMMMCVTRARERTNQELAEGKLPSGLSADAVALLDVIADSQGFVAHAELIGDADG